MRLPGCSGEIPGDRMGQVALKLCTALWYAMYAVDASRVLLQLVGPLVINVMGTIKQFQVQS